MEKDSGVSDWKVESGVYEDSSGEALIIVSGILGTIGGLLQAVGPVGGGISGIMRSCLWGSSALLKIVRLNSRFSVLLIWRERVTVQALSSPDNPPYRGGESPPALGVCAENKLSMCPANSNPNSSYHPSPSAHPTIARPSSISPSPGLTVGSSVSIQDN